MDKWDSKVAVVTRAGTGIGKAISQCLVSHGVTVIGLGSSFIVLKKIADQLSHSFKKGKFYPKAIDINDEMQVVALFRHINRRLGGVHILINCAEEYSESSLIGGKKLAWEAVLQPQIVGLSVFTREAIRSMRRAMNDGVIIHINSVAGHYIPNISLPPMVTVAKHGITVLTEILRRELAGHKIHIRVTSLSPGYVQTEKVEADPQMKNKPLLKMQDVCEAMVFVLSAPPHLEISELTLRAHGSDF